MCYDIQAKLKTQLKRTRRMNQAEFIRELETELKPYITSWHHVSGFSHPNVLIYINENPTLPSLASWGLIPHWVKNQVQANKIRNNTINARGESIFEKPSYRDAAKAKRCLISVDGFYEYHHKNGKTFPHFIHKKSEEPMTLAGLWSNWINKQTGKLLKSFTIVTVKANPLLSKIHNNPKLKEARMPLLLTNDKADEWLNVSHDKTDTNRIKALMTPSEEELIAYTVRPLRGKKAVGNKPEASKQFFYDELNELF